MKQCNQCGKCCLKYSDGGLCATDSEIDYWQEHKPEIYQYVRAGKIWMDPQTGEQLASCPWLKVISETNHSKNPGQIKYGCAIYANRPDDCKHYPVTIEQMINDGCEMLEPVDMENTRRAQKALDRLMADSRPAVD